jgi:hypothetical protein
MKDEPMFAAFLPEFSGFASPGWEAMISGPRRRAAEDRSLFEMNDRVLDADDYLKIFEKTGNEARQRSTIAMSFFEIFSIDLTATYGIGHHLQFKEYDVEADRIVALVPSSIVFCIVTLLARSEPLSINRVLLPDDFAFLRDRIPERDTPEDEAAIRRLQKLDRSSFGELLRAISKPGLERSAMAAIGHQMADDAFQWSGDWREFWTAVEHLYRAKHPGVDPRGRW